MSRFEFSIPAIEEALRELYGIREQIEQENISLRLEKSRLNVQDAEMVRKARDALGRIERKLIQQAYGTSGAIELLKQIEQDVRIAEWKAQMSQTTWGNYMLDATKLFNVGFIGGYAVGDVFWKSDVRVMSWLSALNWGPIGPNVLGIAGGMGEEILRNTSVSGDVLSVERTGEASADFTFYEEGKIAPNIGVEAEGEASFTVAGGKISTGRGLAQSEVAGSIGTVTATGKAECALFQDGEFYPNIGVEGKLSAEGATVSHEGSFGTDDFNIHSSQEVTAGYAEAKAGVNVGTDGIKAEAKAGAYAVKAEATTGFEIFGIRVDVEGEVKGGGASVGGELSITDNEIVIGGEAGLIAGLGLKIKISRD